MKISYLIIGLIASAVIGCSAKDEERQVDNASGVIPQQQLDALQKAHEVEDVLKASADRQQKEIDNL